MKNRSSYLIILLIAVVMHSCSPRIVSTKYYEENRTALDSIEQAYSKLYKQKHFNIEYTNKSFDNISIEIITDSLNYIYEFGSNEHRLQDTLIKYSLDPVVISEMITKMRAIHCAWVSNFDYFVDGEKKSLVFISIKPVGLSRLFSNKRYYILTYFNQKQYYDKRGRLVNNRRQRQLQRVNGEVFKRINDKVSYTVSSTYK